jgi:hypothetical protein
VCAIRGHRHLRGGQKRSWSGSEEPVFLKHENQNIR